MITTPKTWLIGSLISIVFLYIYFHTEIRRLEEKYHELELRLMETNLGYLKNQPVQKKDSKNQNVDNDNDLVVLYNRVPKTGSTSFVGVAYELCKKNAFKVLHINITANMHVMTLNNQYKFAQNISNWNAIKPALFHGHMAFLNFERLGTNKKPVYINIIRKPLDRLISYYYFLRYGDNYRPHLVRRKHGDKITFDECVERDQPDCDPSNMWLQVPFFCGHAADCWKPGNAWALEQAKINLINYYLVVGVTEEMLDFVSVLEATLPRIFKGATEHYLSSNKSHLRQTTSKTAPSEKTISKIQSSTIWKMENDLYEFVLEQFHFIKKKTLLNRDPSSIPQLFMYEKIRPK